MAIITPHHAAHAVPTKTDKLNAELLKDSANTVRSSPSYYLARSGHILSYLVQHAKTSESRAAAGWTLVQLAQSLLSQKGLYEGRKAKARMDELLKAVERDKGSTVKVELEEALMFAGVPEESIPHPYEKPRPPRDDYKGPAFNLPHDHPSGHGTSPGKGAPGDYVDSISGRGVSPSYQMEDPERWKEAQDLAAFGLEDAVKSNSDEEIARIARQRYYAQSFTHPDMPQPGTPGFSEAIKNIDATGALVEDRILNELAPEKTNGTQFFNLADKLAPGAFLFGPEAGAAAKSAAAIGKKYGPDAVWLLKQSGFSASGLSTLNGVDRATILGNGALDDLAQLNYLAAKHPEVRALLDKIELKYGGVAHSQIPAKDRNAKLPGYTHHIENTQPKNRGANMRALARVNPQSNLATLNKVKAGEPIRAPNGKTAEELANPPAEGETPEKKLERIRSLQHIHAVASDLREIAQRLGAPKELVATLMVAEAFTSIAVAAATGGPATAAVVTVIKLVQSLIGLFDDGPSPMERLHQEIVALRKQMEALSDQITEQNRALSAEVRHQFRLTLQMLAHLEQKSDRRFDALDKQVARSRGQLEDILTEQERQNFRQDEQLQKNDLKNVNSSLKILTPSWSTQRSQRRDLSTKNNTVDPSSYDKELREIMEFGLIHSRDPHWTGSPHLDKSAEPANRNATGASSIDTATKLDENLVQELNRITPGSGMAPLDSALKALGLPSIAVPLTKEEKSALQITPSEPFRDEAPMDITAWKTGAEKLATAMDHVQKSLPEYETQFKDLQCSADPNLEKLRLYMKKGYEQRARLENLVPRDSNNRPSSAHLATLLGNYEHYLEQANATLQLTRNEFFREDPAATDLNNPIDTDELRKNFASTLNADIEYCPQPIGSSSANKSTIHGPKRKLRTPQEWAKLVPEEYLHLAKLSPGSAIQICYSDPGFTEFSDKWSEVDDSTVKKERFAKSGLNIEVRYLPTSSGPTHTIHKLRVTDPTPVLIETTTYRSVQLERIQQNGGFREVGGGKGDFVSAHAYTTELLNGRDPSNPAVARQLQLAKESDRDLLALMEKQKTKNARFVGFKLLKSVNTPPGEKAEETAMSKWTDPKLGWESEIIAFASQGGSSIVEDWMLKKDVDQAREQARNRADTLRANAYLKAKYKTQKEVFDSQSPTGKSLHHLEAALNTFKLAAQNAYGDSYYENPELRNLVDSLSTRNRILALAGMEKGFEHTQKSIEQSRSNLRALLAMLSDPTQGKITQPKDKGFEAAMGALASHYLKIAMSPPCAETEEQARRQLVAIQKSAELAARDSRPGAPKPVTLKNRDRVYHRLAKDGKLSVSEIVFFEQLAAAATAKQPLLDRQPIETMVDKLIATRDQLHFLPKGDANALMQIYAQSGHLPSEEKIAAMRAYAAAVSNHPRYERLTNQPSLSNQKAAQALRQAESSELISANPKALTTQQIHKLREDQDAEVAKIREKKKYWADLREQWQKKIALIDIKQSEVDDFLKNIKWREERLGNGALKRENFKLHEEVKMAQTYAGMIKRLTDKARSLKMQIDSVSEQIQGCSELAEIDRLEKEASPKTEILEIENWKYTTKPGFPDPVTESKANGYPDHWFFWQEPSLPLVHQAGTLEVDIEGKQLMHEYFRQMRMLQATSVVATYVGTVAEEEPTWNSNDRSYPTRIAPGPKPPPKSSQQIPDVAGL